MYCLRSLKFSLHLRKLIFNVLKTCSAFVNVISMWNERNTHMLGIIGWTHQLEMSPWEWPELVAQVNCSENEIQNQRNLKLREGKQKKKNNRNDNNNSNSKNNNRKWLLCFVSFWILLFRLQTVALGKKGFLYCLRRSHCCCCCLCLYEFVRDLLVCGCV